MEHVELRLGDDELFERLVQAGLPEGQNLTFATKDRATISGKPAVVISFAVQTPDGQVHPVQAVTTVACFLAAATAMRARYTGILS